MRPIRLIKEFLRWRKQRYDKALEMAVDRHLDRYGIMSIPPAFSYHKNARYWCRYGIEHRKEIIKLRNDIFMKIKND